MTPDEQLDTVLKYLDTVKVFFMMAPDIKKHTLPDTTDKDFDMLLDKLVLDGHVLQKNLLGDNVDTLLPPAGYRINFQGRQFLSLGGYSSQRKKTIWSNRFTTAKTPANILNAIIIIILTAVSIGVSYDGKQTDLKIDKQQLQIDKQQLQLDKQAATIDSLQHLRITTKPDTTK